MHTRPPFCAVVIAVLVLVGPESVAQTLGKLRDAVRKPNSQESSRKKKRSVDEDSPSLSFGVLFGSSDDDDGGGLDQLAGKMFFAAASSPFVVPRAMLGDEGDDAYYPKHPYANASCGIVFDDEAPGAHDSLLVFQSAYGTNFAELDHAHGRIFGDTTNRLGIDSEFFYRREDLPVGDDDLWHGDFNFTYRFAQNELWQFRAGLGVNWLSDRFGAEAGFNTTYGVEWFPRDPIIVSGLIDWGRLGSSSLFHFRSTIGATHNGWGVFTGFDYLKIGDAEIPAWINGIEYRF